MTASTSCAHSSAGEILLNLRRARGLGFCVSQAHAEFMARFFNQRGAPSAALTSDS